MLRVGVQLETIFGSLPFLYLVVSLACLSSSFHFLLSYALELVKPRTIHSCTAGLSGVIFALRALQGSDLSLQRRRRSFWGIPVPGGVWGEMILASILMPRVSFWGHFSGIVSGYCVAWLMKAFRRGWIRAEPWCFLIRRDILEPLVILLFVYLWTRYRAA